MSQRVFRGSGNFSFSPPHSKSKISRLQLEIEGEHSFFMTLWFLKSEKSYYRAGGDRQRKIGEP